MATARDMYKGSDDYTDVKCSVCAKQNTDKIADYYCYDCRKHLCTSCSGIHNDHIENHNVVQGRGDNKDVLTERCGKHAEELITLYCRQHNKLLCRKCHLLDHRKCQDLQNIRESADELNADPELQAVPAQLKSALDNINKAIEALDNHKACIQNTGDGFLKDLEEYAKKLLSRIKELREKGKADIKSKQEELLSEAKQHRQACVLCKDEISQCYDKITKSNEWKANMFVLKKKGQTITQKANTLYNDSDSLLNKHQFSFQTNMKVFDSLKCFSSLVNDVYTNVQDISSLSAVGGVVQATVGRPGDSRVEKLAERPVEKPSGESQQVRKIIAHEKNRCSIYGCCALSDGSLVITDSSNSRLKRVDPSSGTITQCCDTDPGPVDVCCNGSQELVVAVGSTQVHVYCAVCLIRTRTIELGHQTLSIDCHAGLLYCVTVPGRGNIILYVHHVSDGRKLREILLEDFCPNITGISGIAVNGSGDLLYVTDWETGLFCVNTNGQRIFHLSLNDLGLSGAQGVTTDHRGHVFVSCYVSNNVVKVTEDGHVVGQLLSGRDGIEKPCCLSYDESKSQLCVGGVSDQILLVEW